jgi:Ser/Thr protein kinase RdoA (MazF antagonist)
MTLDAALPTLQTLAEASLSLWDIPPDATVRLINVSENTTYLVEARSHKSVLRIHRAGYHTRRAIECELEWIEALGRDTDVRTPGVYVGRNGSVIQQGQIDGLDAPRFMVLFKFVEGDPPSEDGDLTAGFRELGSIAARCHDHALTWQKPKDFKRLTWDVDAVFGSAPTWGRWQDAPGITEQERPVLMRVESTIRDRLVLFGKAPERFNLIHADMRLANLLIDENKTRLIDFDDCGFGWFLYDFAAAISFIEDDPRIPDMKAAWLEGYRSLRAISAEEEAEIDTFVMLRRMALLAWIGSHIEAPEPQALAPDFAERTAALGEAWLSRL